MTIAQRCSGIIAAVLTLAAGLSIPHTVKAEDLVDFLWGGSAEYGGGRSIVSFDPQYKAGQIIVSFSDRRLYLITKPGQAITYPVAVPMGEARWQGVTFISDKRVNPPWTPTPDMLRQNPKLPHWVPGGHPMNPLGVRAMYLGSSSYRIHGTDAPWTIGQPVSHGCIRMINEDVLDLYPRVQVGTRVTVTWQRFSTTAVASNEYSSAGSSSASSSGGANGRPDAGSIGSLFFWDNDQTPPPPVQPKKKYTSASTPVKKTSATGQDASPAAAKKASTTDKSADASETMPSATKASASADESLPAQKASTQSQ